MRGPGWLFNTNGQTMEIAGAGWEFYDVGKTPVISIEEYESPIHESYKIDRDADWNVSIKGGSKIDKRPYNWFHVDTAHNNDSWQVIVSSKMGYTVTLSDADPFKLYYPGLDFEYVPSAKGES